MIASYMPVPGHEVLRMLKLERFRVREFLRTCLDLEGSPVAAELWEKVETALDAFEDVQ